ncbi:unnamed protein product, partial [Brugia timori]|uniref:DUF4283 domain-containing protein n=1 Tax=Brugia timori TaxID=42155 RepID=A0A0R3QHL4_9BILA
MADLVWVISQLTDVEGNILIQDIMNLVAPVTNEERKLYETLDFGEYRADIGAIKLLSDSKEKILMKRWRYLTLSLHGWRRCEMVIPAKVTGKFSIRLVPKMKPAKVNRHLNALRKIRISLPITSSKWFSRYLQPLHSGVYWLSDFKDSPIMCGIAPDYIREGDSIPMTRS